MPDFDVILGNDELKRLLKNTAKSKRFSHSYIIEGQRGSGRKTTARLLAASIVCESDNSPCGKCKHCFKSEKGIHPDIIYFKPADEDKKSIGVNSVRLLKEDSAVAPNEAEKKVYIIENAEKLTVQAQNAFLKLLEEPGYFCVFILVLEAGNSLIPTVMSRCQILKMSPVSDELMYKYLAEKYPEKKQDIMTAVKVSRGFLGSAINYLEDDSDKPQKNLAKEFLYKLTGKSEYNFMLLTQSINKADFFKEFLEELYCFLRDISVYKISEREEDIVFYDQKDVIMELADKFTLKQIIKLTDVVNSAADAADKSCNLKLWVTYMFTKSWECLY